MSESITFRGAFIRYFDVRQAKEGGGVFVRLHMSADFSSTVVEKMDWTDPGESVASAKLTGALLATHMILTPGDKQLQSHELQLDISEVTDFQIVTLNDDERETKGRELRFIARSPVDGAEALLGQYIRRVGRHQGALKVSYSKQEELPLQKEEERPAAKGDKPAKAKSGCKACDVGIPLRENDDAEHVDGRPCANWDKPLNPAPPPENAVLGVAPTMAEKKKARLDEERKKKELREKSGMEVVH